MALHKGDEVEVTRDVKTTDGLFGTTVKKGTTGVVMKVPDGLLRSDCQVRLDPKGKKVDLPEDALKKKAAGWL